MGSKAEVLEKFALGFKKLDEAVAAVEDFLGMQTCDGTGRCENGSCWFRKLIVSFCILERSRLGLCTLQCLGSCQSNGWHTLRGHSRRLMK